MFSLTDDQWQAVSRNFQTSWKPAKNARKVFEALVAVALADGDWKVIQAPNAPTRPTVQKYAIIWNRDGTITKSFNTLNKSSLVENIGTKLSTNSLNPILPTRSKPKSKTKKVYSVATSTKTTQSKVLERSAPTKSKVLQVNSDTIAAKAVTKAKETERRKNLVLSTLQSFGEGFSVYSVWKYFSNSTKLPHLSRLFIENIIRDELKEGRLIGNLSKVLQVNKNPETKEASASSTPKVLNQTESEKTWQSFLDSYSKLHHMQKKQVQKLAIAWANSFN